MAWENHEPTNWRTAIISLIVAGVGYVAKDASTHSTEDQVRTSTVAAAQEAAKP
jgi:hypothetical protein